MEDQHNNKMMDILVTSKHFQKIFKLWGSNRLRDPSWFFDMMPDGTHSGPAPSNGYF